ncbi:MAG TPA: ABC transporter substrate-binding protein [Stellaceae bacterium]|nr:ABC transporter substrate-binding protein [Stellaceae bacterium]
MISRAMGVAVAAMLALAGTASAQDGKPWRHGIIQAKSDAGIMMMVTQGFAKKQGLNLELLQFKNDVVEIQAMLSGGIDSFDGSPGAAIAAAARGADVKVIGCQWPGVPYDIFVRPNIKTVQDLKGRTLAISAPGASPDVVARAVLAKYGVPAADVKIANLGADLDRFKAVVAGVADATVVTDEYEPIAAKEGVKVLLHTQDVVPEYMRVCVFTTGATLAKHEDDAARFLAAEMTAFQYALTHRDAVIKLTHKIIHDKPDDPRPAFIYDDAVKKKAIDPEFSLPVDKLRWMAKVLYDNHTLRQPFDVTRMIAPGPREKALALLGK